MGKGRHVNVRTWPHSLRSAWAGNACLPLYKHGETWLIELANAHGLPRPFNGTLISFFPKEITH